MTLFDMFRKKKQADQKKPVTPADVAEEKKEEHEAPSITIAADVADTIYRIIKAPRVTEKANKGEALRQYTIDVFPWVNKSEAKKAIEQLYRVNVQRIRMAKTYGKVRRLGKFEGWKTGTKKMIITLKEGQKIERAM